MYSLVNRMYYQKYHQSHVCNIMLVLNVAMLVINVANLKMILISAKQLKNSLYIKIKQ